VCRPAHRVAHPHRPARLPLRPEGLLGGTVHPLSFRTLPDVHNRFRAASIVIDRVPRGRCRRRRGGRVFMRVRRWAGALVALTAST
jgi:hypothetical protein